MGYHEGGISNAFLDVLNGGTAQSCPFSDRKLRQPPSLANLPKFLCDRIRKGLAGFEVQLSKAKVDYFCRLRYYSMLLERLNY